MAGYLSFSYIYDTILLNYHSVQATINNEIAMGYTNPYASSTGMNFLISTLASFDKENPLSSSAVTNFGHWSNSWHNNERRETR